MVSERVTVEGHLLDENSLARLLAQLDQLGVRFQIRRFRIGEFAVDPSMIELLLHAETADGMAHALKVCRDVGAQVDDEDAELVVADHDGVLPEDFYSTTNFTTHVRVDGQWLPVERLEMDVGIRVVHSGGHLRAEACPMHHVRVGDRLVVGYRGVKVTPDVDLDESDEDFKFMGNEVSSERPKARVIAHCAEAMRTAKAEGLKVIFVGGPAIVHSGSAKYLAGLIERGWIDVLFAGNALAAHDIEAAMLGTSLGVDLDRGVQTSHGHTHHLRAINRVRRSGSIAQAVEEGYLTSGVMYACVKHGVPFVLAGSIRDDGPLPDVITDNVKAQDAMRAHVPGAGVAIMVATTLHSVATGNCLPAKVKTYCVDNDADTVIKLTDRGTHQAIGLVTDCEYFLKELSANLPDTAPRSR